MRTLISLFFIATTTVAAFGCEDESPVEEAAEEVGVNDESALEEAGEDIEEAAEEATE